MDVLFNAIKDFGFPVVVCIYLLYTLNYHLEEIKKTLVGKMDDIIANQLKILTEVSAIRTSQVDNLESGRGRASK
jgi:hypothetical protein